MLPFKQEHHSPYLSMNYYVGSPGLRFELRIQLARPVTEGALIGGRVYIDNGKEALKRNIFHKWWNEDDNPEGCSVDKNNDNADTATADHFFWFEPGESTHTISGFYQSSSQSRQKK